MMQSADSCFIMVIGGLGYIGSHTTLALLNDGFNVIVIDNLIHCTPSVVSNLTKLAENNSESTGRKMPELHIHNVDYQSPEMASLMKLYDKSSPDISESRISAVIHLAAYKIISESITDPLRYYSNNVSGLVDLLRLLRMHHITRFVFSSSAAVYGNRENSDDPLNEELVVHHKESSNNTAVAALTSPYARTKYFAEVILADVAAADSSWNITALRYFNPVGCHSSGLLTENHNKHSSNLFSIISQVLNQERNSLAIFGSDWGTHDGTAVRDFVHVLDVARGHVKAIRKGHNNGFRAYNLGSGRGTTILEIVTCVETISGRQIPVRQARRRPGDVGVCVAATERAEKELGWRPIETIEACVRDMLRAL